MGLIMISKNTSVTAKTIFITATKFRKKSGKDLLGKFLNVWTEAHRNLKGYGHKGYFLIKS